MFKLIVCVMCLLITIDVVQCEPEYFYISEVNGWVAYQAIPATWEEALLKCHFEGAILASPEDENITNILRKAVGESTSSQRIFLGVHALYSAGDFFSVEGVPLSDMKIKYRNLQRNQDQSWMVPVSDGSTADPGACMTMDVDDQTYYMYTSSCSERHPYVCYRKENAVINECGTFDNDYHLNQHTGSCYKFHGDYQTWTRAHMICAAEGGHLVILNNQEETNFVKTLFPLTRSHNSWQVMHIGIRAWSNDRVWLTIHGESMKNVYNTWGPGQPDNYENRQNCGRMLKNGNLDDISCETKAIFVCEKDPKREKYEEVS